MWYIFKLKYALILKKQRKKTISFIPNYDLYILICTDLTTNFKNVLAAFEF